MTRKIIYAHIYALWLFVLLNSRFFFRVLFRRDSCMFIFPTTRLMQVFSCSRIRSLTHHRKNTHRARGECESACEKWREWAWECWVSKCPQKEILQNKKKAQKKIRHTLLNEMQARSKRFGPRRSYMYNVEALYTFFSSPFFFNFFSRNIITYKYIIIYIEERKEVWKWLQCENGRARKFFFLF